MAKLSNIPTIEELNSVNYVLFVAISLCDNENLCVTDSVRRICSSRVLGGKPISFTRVIELCDQMKLLIKKGPRVALTHLSKQFMSLNQNRSYEISDDQRTFIIENFIFQGAWESHSRGFFLNFSPNYRLLTFEFSIRDNPVPKKYNPILQLLKRLKVIEIKDGIAFVSPYYVKFVKDLLAKKNVITEEQLKKLIEADEEFGLLAEEAVLKFERKRLLILGRVPESELVRRISQFDVNAGYDIASFNGDIPSLEPDRFIEVKASQQKAIRFYWSSNEYEKAILLGDTYWIYFIGNFKEKQNEITPIIIQNPVKRIPEVTEFRMHVAKYIIEATDGLSVKPFRYEDIKGFLI